MDSKKRILIIGFEKKEAISYPHLKDVTDYFKFQCEADYLYFRERGYFLGSSTSMKANIQYMISILISSFHLTQFIYKNICNKYEKIIVIDNFAYVVISMFAKNTSLWSHDFVTNDQVHKNSMYQKTINKLTNYFLKQRQKIIIQDTNRLKLFCITHCLNYSDLDIFCLPVSGCPTISEQITKTPIVPRILQIGGINQHRSYSYDLMKHYENNATKYELHLHGFFDQFIKEEINHLKHIPFCSTLELEPNKVNKIIEKCDIGFIGYKTDNLNFYYISFASGQLVEFLKLGKPIIVFGNTDLVNLVKEHNLGFAIVSLEELNSAISYILINYEQLSINCKKLFNEKYNIQNYLENLHLWLYK
jgi:glycosyltransferase involved in cell wall biosynthesis